MKSQESYALNNPDFNVVRIFAERPNVNMAFPTIVLPDAADRPESNSVVALVKPNGHPTSAWFEWGTSMNYGNTSAQQFVGDGELPVKIHENFDSLTPYKVYHVRVAAENSTGRVYGPHQLLVFMNRSIVAPRMFSPPVFTLSQNYPNPFNPGTKIEFHLDVHAVVTVKVYNTLGQEVATLADRREFGEGKNTLNFDGANLPSGVYYYRIIAHDNQNNPLFTSVRKMLLVK